MMAVVLYTSVSQDEVLGRLFGLTVEEDTTSILGSVVTRTLTLNMGYLAGAPTAPPTFQGSGASPLVDNEAVVWSTSASDGPGGIGARTITIIYDDAEGNTGTVTVTLEGQTPVPIPLAVGTNGVAKVHTGGMIIASSGSLDNNVGQITVAVLNPALPSAEQDQLEEGEPSAQPQSPQDILQMRLGQPIAYIPNSYYSYAMQTNPSSTPIEAPSVGQALPQATIHVASTDAFLASGTIDVPTTTGTSQVTYSGVTETSFTGCAGGTGVMEEDTSVMAPAPLAPTPLLLKQYMTNFFTNRLARALATQVTAATPALV